MSITFDDDDIPTIDLTEDKPVARAVAVSDTKKSEKTETDDDIAAGKVCQWSTDGTIFTASKTTVKELKPGAYEISMSPQIGLYFEKYKVKTEELLKFPDTNSDQVIDEIRKFWTKRPIFKEYELPFKRGILLYGPPGGGKSSTIQFVMKDVIEKGGVVLNFTHPDYFITGMRTLRVIQPETPVVVVMEDIDAILDQYNESSVLNILDGADQIESTVFLATTNYPEKLGARIVDRPSRFDKRFKINTPNAEVRRFYLDHLFEKINPKIDLDGWVEDTEGLSIAHLKELFVAVMILGNTYDEAINTLLNMKEEISSERDDETKSFGFSTSKRDALGRKKKAGFGARNDDTGGCGG